MSLLFSPLSLVQFYWPGLILSNGNLGIELNTSIQVRYSGDSPVPTHVGDYRVSYCTLAVRLLGFGFGFSLTRQNEGGAA